jgi:hypothetical protein
MIFTMPRYPAAVTGAGPCSDGGRGASRGGAERAWTATPPSRLPALRPLRSVLAPGRAPFAAGGAGLGGRELMRGALRMRRLSTLPGNLSPCRGVHGRQSATTLISRTFLHEGRKRRLHGWPVSGAARGR